MAIDKIIPRKLVKDKDERLVQEGDMTHALNVTISESGEGTQGVLKNLYGTAACNGFMPANGDYTVIGKCVDQINDYIYFFVCDNNGADHRILRHSPSNNTFTKVIASSRLNFDKEHPIKADIISSDFSKSGSIQSLLYFTDNHNPPRRINVDKAMSDGYSQMSDLDFEKSVSVIKAPALEPITFTFETDEDLFINNLKNRYFQFASQLVYEDGEESAISTYSKLAVSDASSYDSLNTVGSAQVPNTHNVIKVKINYSPVVGDKKYSPGVKLFRLLARDGNDGPFLKMDEFDPSQSITQLIHGSSTKIYDKNTGEYLFYNAKNYGAIDSNTVNKTYDNVPLKAEGQAIAGNRLFYSNYEEGRDKHNVSGASLTVKYAEDAGFRTVLDPAANIVTVSGDDITINLLAGTSFDSFEIGGTADQNTVVPKGVNINVSFSYDPVGDMRLASDELATVEFKTYRSTEIDENDSFWNQLVEGLIWFWTPYDGVTDPDFDNVWVAEEFTTKVHFGKGNDADASAQYIPIGQSTSGKIVVSLNVTTSREMSVQQIGQLLADQAEGVRLSKTWKSKGGSAPSFKGRVDDVYNGILTAGSVVDFVNNNVKVYEETDLDSSTVTMASTNIANAYSTAVFAHDDITPDPTLGYAQFTIKPRVAELDMSDLFKGSPIEQISGASNYPVYNEVSTSPSITGYFGTSQSSVQYDWTSGDYDFGFSYTAGSSAGYVPTFSPTFKAGSSYDVGLVFYDEYNRSSFVQELGTVYIKSLFERGSAGKGAASVEVEFPAATEDPPDWAKRYQIVVSENNTYQSFLQYTTGAAYIPVEQPGVNNSPVRSDDTKIYVSLKTLDNYNERSDNPREYSYTKGDKLRVLQADTGSTTETVTYPTARENGADSDRPVEFDIIGVETYEVAQDNPCCDLTAGSQHEDQFIGTFLILSAPAIDSGVNNLQYPGYDFYSVYRALTGTAILYPSTDQPSTVQYWGRKTVVEILTPRLEMGDKFYYEVGNSTEIRQYKNTNYSNYGPPVVVDGDAWIRPVACISALYDASHGWETEHPEHWSYIVRSLESFAPSESLKNKNLWSKGRAHLPYRSESSRRIQNGILYSDAYVEDGNVLQLSSFNPSLGNFSDLDGSYGAIRYLANHDDSLVALQEDRMSFIPINKNIIEYVDGGGGLAVSTNVVGQANYYSGDYGCGSNPDAVLKIDGKVFFVDASRSKVMMHSNGQLVPISDTDMTSFFFKEMALARANGGVKFATGFDSRTDVFYVTIKPVGSYPGVTAAYNTRLRVWESLASFKPDMYASLDDSFVSCKYVSLTNPGAGNDVGLILFDHNEAAPRNKFYGSNYSSEIKTISKLNPSLVKSYDALSYEGTNTWASDSISTDLGQSSNAYNFVEKEGAKYSFIGRDTSATSSAQIKSAGVVNITPADAQSSVSVSNIDLDRSSIIGLELYVLSNENLVKASDSDQSAVITAASGNQITIEGTIDETIVVDDAKLFAQGNKAVDGDKLRGRYATISMSNSSTSPTELYCINAHITESGLNHALGQE